MVTLVPPGQIQPAAARAADYARQSRAESTLRAYSSSWRRFTAWNSATNNQLEEHGYCGTLPATYTVVAAYIAHLADTGSKPATIQRALSAIAAYHRAAGHQDPTKHDGVREALKGIRRALGTAQKGKTALLTNDLARLLQFIPASPIGTRDRAIILLGFAGAFRRSELAALNVEDIAWEADGMRIELRSSKTDQERAGVQVGILRGQTDMCPCAAVEAWLRVLTERAGAPPSGALFVRSGDHRLSPAAIAETVKRYARKAGMDASALAGHSLRAGFATQAILNNVQDQLVMRQTRHKSAAVFQKYVRPAKLFRDNASGKVGL
jgi:site-specific recombinase XerD